MSHDQVSRRVKMIPCASNSAEPIYLGGCMYGRLRYLCPCAGVPAPWLVQGMQARRAGVYKCQGLSGSRAAASLFACLVCYILFQNESLEEETSFLASLIRAGQSHREESARICIVSRPHMFILLEVQLSVLFR